MERKGTINLSHDSYETAHSVSFCEVNYHYLLIGVSATFEHIIR